jgi:TetR/AcrR family transcriptional regulator
MSPASASHEGDILAAACELFARHGYDAVSTSAIAERAGVSKANVYHHFRSKEDLYLAVLRHVCEEASTHLDGALSSDGPVLDRLNEFARHHLRQMCDDPVQTRLMMREIVEHSQHRGQKLAREVFGSGFADVVALFRRGQEEGELRADIDPAFAALLMLAANTCFFQWREVMRHTPDIDFADDLDGYAERVIDMLAHGISVEPAPAKRGRKTAACASRAKTLKRKN